jgi:hypothetical protein
MEAACVKTMEDGIMDRNLSMMCTLENKQAVDTETFLKEIAKRYDNM